MQILLHYNFSASEIEDENYPALFEQRRRDAIFAFVGRREDGKLLALRDHLGSVPLYYRYEQKQFRFATDLSSLVKAGDTLNPQGVAYFIGTATAKLVPLIADIFCVPPGTAVLFNPDNGSHQILYRYVMRPVKIPVQISMHDLANETEGLFAQAIARTLKQDTVGVYMSGGIDSAMIGIHLKKLGAKVHAYTSAPWGKQSSEIKYAQINAERIKVDQHYLDILETDIYLKATQQIPQLYGSPHGTSTSVAVTAIWQRTPIVQERQIYFGQNSDTMTCSVPAQYATYFTHWMPIEVRQRLHPLFTKRDLVEQYLYFGSRGIVTQDPMLEYIPTQANAVQRLTLAGMYVMHSPSDGEVLSQPAVRRNISTANPYYDVDLIEFCLGTPLHHRLGLKRDARPPMLFEKRIFRQMALKYLPRELVYRKKGFTVSADRDDTSRDLLKTFPAQVENVRVADDEQRFSAGILQRWCSEHQIHLNYQ